MFKENDKLELKTINITRKISTKAHWTINMYSYVYKLKTEILEKILDKAGKLKSKKKFIKSTIESSQL